MTAPSPLNAVNLQQLSEALTTLNEERSSLVSAEAVAGLVVSLDPDQAGVNQLRASELGRSGGRGGGSCHQ